jgi:hypothetical protein
MILKRNNKERLKKTIVNIGQSTINHNNKMFLVN